MVEYSRYMFSDSDKLVMLSEELKHVRNYIEIQKIRFLGMIEYTEDVSEKYKKVMLPPFVLQGFVENSIKYGLRAKKLNHLEIHAEVFRKYYLKITIRDDGPGFDEERMEMLKQEVPDSVCRVLMQRYKNWKLVVRTNGQNELYDMKKDPLEAHNLYGLPEYKAVQDEMTAKMLTWLIHSSDVVPKDPAYRGGER